jgi:hypothetical protein
VQVFYFCNLAIGASALNVLEYRYLMQHIDQIRWNQLITNCVVVNNTYEYKLPVKMGIPRIKKYIRLSYFRRLKLF